jgi:hypothetical protein
MSDLISGGAGVNGEVSVNGKDGLPLVQLLATDTEAVIGAGQKDGRPARLTMYDGEANQTVNLSAANASLQLGGASTNGTVTVSGKDGRPLVQLSATDTEAVIGLGQSNGRPGRLSMYDGNGNGTIELTGATGDILLYNADCAEEFDADAQGGELEPGTVVSLREDGLLRAACGPYDEAVIGVISGAAKYKPALILDRRNTGSCRRPVALMGKVFCRVEADTHPIKTGNLLTSSPRPGCGMKADSAVARAGTIFGKALASLEKGTALIPILVMLR